MSVIHDSPRYTQSIEYQPTSVADSPNSLMCDIPVVPEVSLTELMDSVLYLVPTEEVDKVCKQLITNGDIVNPETNVRWKCLPEDPKDLAKNVRQDETKVFKFFEQIADAINRSRSNIESRLKLRVTGTTKLASHRDNTSRPDGYFELSSTNIGTRVSWADIVMPMEFKNKDGGKDKIDDYRKMMWSLNMVMRTDARRRFVHGLTCENTTGRLWYGDRSDIVASEEFDINKDWRCLVRIILSTLLAREDQLGYDPSVVARFSDNPKLEPVYDITIYNSKTKDTAVYRTIDVISNAGADNSVGRGTRVWSTQEMRDGKLVGPVYVLKGIWVHPDRPAEHAILEEIQEKQPDYSRYFLTPVNHGFAPLEPANASVPFDTHSPLGLKRDWKPTGQVLNKHRSDSVDAKTPSDTRNSVGPELVAKPAGEGFRDSHRLSTDSRQLYWIVFKERGTPVHDLTDFTNVFTAIRGAWEGLHAIHLCDYVHRDVSSGNVLLVPASPLDNLPERGVIMDLEYCKKVTDTSAPGDVRTGTEDFMATEVACAEHNRLADIRFPEPSVDSLDAIKEDKSTTQPDWGPLPSFRHNLLHDMESIWWLCIWMMLRLVPSGEAVSIWGTTYSKVFDNVIARTRFLEKNNTFLKHTSHLSELRLLRERMGFWRSALNNCYTVAYRQFNESPDSLTVIRIDSKMLQVSYDVGREVLRTMWEASSQLSTTFVPCSRACSRTVITKRSRTETKSQHAGLSTPQAGRSAASSSSSRKPPQSNDAVFRDPKKRRYVTKAVLPEENTP